MGKYTTVGNTTAPGDLRFTPNGKAVCNFTVAETTRRLSLIHISEPTRQVR